MLNRSLFALTIAFALAAGTFASAAPGDSSITVRNETAFVVAVEAEQLAPRHHWITFVVSALHSQTKPISGPVGRFEVRLKVYAFGGIELPPKQLNVRAGTTGRIVVDRNAHNDRGDFDFTVAAAP